jgi:hypothetical protein
MGVFILIILAMCVFVPLALSPIAFLIWRNGKRVAWRRFMQTSPKCLRCGYDMTGLTEARCPECGAEYTLDQLWMAQRDIVHDSANRGDP